MAWRACNSFSLGCRAVIALICLICFRVRGRVTTRIISVKMMIDRPKLLNRPLYNTTRMFSVGLTSTLSKNQITLPLLLGGYPPHFYPVFHVHSPHGAVLNPHEYHIPVPAQGRLYAGVQVLGDL